MTGLDHCGYQQVRMSDTEGEQGTQPWTEKYRPETTSQIQGNNKNVTALKGWVEDFEPGDEAQLLYGPPGVGKSSTVQAIGNEMDVPVKEINASDARRTDEIAEFVDEARSTPYDADLKIVMLDEVDSMSGRSNIHPLLELLDDPPNPIVLICNDTYEVDDRIMNRVNDRKFKLGVRSRKAKLRKIVKAEDLDYGASTIQMLAQRENLRDAISDLQMLAQSEGDIAQENERSYEGSHFDEIDAVRQGKPVSLSETPDKTALWIDKNLRGRWRLVEAAAAWDALSRSDKWLGRVKHNDYHWWKWANELQEQIPFLRLTSPYDGYVKTSGPDYYGWDNIDSDVKSLYHTLSEGRTDSFEMGASLYEFSQAVLPLLEDLDTEEKYELALNYGLEDAEIEALGADPEGYEDWRTGQNREIGTTDDTPGSESSFMDW